MTRSQRHMKILEIISAFDIETQEEIVERLKAAGYEFTQATISRDIKDMGLVKVLMENKHYKYVYVNSEIKNLSNKLLNVFKEAVLSINYSVNNIVIKIKVFFIIKLLMIYFSGCLKLFIFPQRLKIFYHLFRIIRLCYRTHHCQRRYAAI